MSHPEKFAILIAGEACAQPSLLQNRLNQDVPPLTRK